MEGTEFAKSLNLLYYNLKVTAKKLQSCIRENIGNINREKLILEKYLYLENMCPINFKAEKNTIWCFPP